MNADAFVLDDDSALSGEFAEAVLGRALGAEVESLLREAARLRHAPGQAESLLMRARALAPNHPAPLIALYRFHFYGHRLREARTTAEQALELARQALGPEFGRTPPSSDQARFDAATRFYLFVLKGYAYLSLRLGDLPAGAQALDELRRLDPEDRVGGAVLARVLTRAGRSEDDEDDASAASTARGWAPGSAA